MKYLKGGLKMKTYKVYCEFYIQAENEEKAEDIVIEDMSYNNFYEEHIMLTEETLPEGEEYFKVDWEDNY